MSVTPRFKPRVAFQGRPGAFSEDAAMQLLGPEIELVPRETFADLFNSVECGAADYVLAPIENSLAGSIQSCRDLLCRSPLVITGEVIIPIGQQLIGLPGSSFADIREVQSHPVALAQCRQFFMSNTQLVQIEANDTAGSVAEVVARGYIHRAAIASKRAAALHGGQILRENIQDDEHNFTRFLLLSSAELIRRTGRQVLDEAYVDEKGAGALKTLFANASVKNTR